MTHEPDPTSAGPETCEPADLKLRSRAVWRSLACPGAGFARLGDGRRAVCCVLVSAGAVLALACFVFKPSSAVLGLYLVLLLLAAAALWLVEQGDVRRLAPRPPRPRFLVAGFPVTAV